MTFDNAALWQRTVDQLYFVIALDSGQILLPPPDYLSQIYNHLHSQFASDVLFYTALGTTRTSVLLFPEARQSTSTAEVLMVLGWLSQFLPTVSGPACRLQAPRAQPM